MFGLKVHKFIHLLITSWCCVCLFVAIILIPHNRFATWVPVVCVPVIGISWLILSLRIRALNTRAEDANYRNCPFCDYETVTKDSGHLCPECGAAFKQGELRRTWLNKVRWLQGEQIPMDQWRTAIPPKTIEWKSPRVLRERIFERGELICPHCTHTLFDQGDHLRCFECGFHCQAEELQPMWKMKWRGGPS